jgi:quercetin dioxygenase-like cupin family protein
VQVATHLRELSTTGGFTRTPVQLGSTLDQRISAVVVAIPPGGTFPLHSHPHSEDLFVLLNGDGFVVEPTRRTRVSAFDVVWVPSGLSHGLVAGDTGVVELGFQAPPDSTPSPARDSDGPSQLQVLPLFPAAQGSRFGPVLGGALLSARPAHILPGEERTIESGSNGSVVALLTGQVRLGVQVLPPSVFVLSENERVSVLGIESSLLLHVQPRRPAYSRLE